MSSKTKLYHKIQSSTLLKWNTQLRESANKSHFTNALSIYLQMLRSGSSPNAFTFPFALKSCAALSLPFTGEQLHSHVFKTGCLLEPFVQTALISMYGRCALIDNARKVFDENRQSRILEVGMSIHGFCVKFGLVMDMSVGNCLLTMYVKCGEVGSARKLFNDIPGKGLITWNAMINGYSQNGLATDVLELYREMELSGVSPDAVTLAGVLSSCAHLGAQSVGREIEERMNVCGFASNPFLNNALINLYARCGNLVRARDIFDGMPVKSVVSWTAILGGYGMHGEGETAVKLFNDMIRTGVRPDGTAFVSVLSACSHAGLIDKGLEYFSMMQNQGHPTGKYEA
ncbi:pentatricopeptide repeat-containing protein, putative [Ricinus communis]|uniref:Pentatricopeptide repeat-containing protein, putative n=1 Tax=Ricinus communis TaxID=3988 RepID=B9SWG0_RICCO|nr:pentatricopeptide repeat-containing protein, putative [Ricinus communis]